MNEIKTGACINYISIIVRAATQFFLTPFTLSSLGENEYGIFMLSNSVIAWLSLTDFGLGVTVNKYIATYHAKKENDREAHFLGQAHDAVLLPGAAHLRGGHDLLCKPGRPVPQSVRAGA